MEGIYINAKKLENNKVSNLGIKSLPFVDYWLIVNNDIQFEVGSLDMFAKNSNSETLLLSNGNPKWWILSYKTQWILEQKGCRIPRRRYDEG